MSGTTEAALPAIPDKRYFAIGEASDLCGVKPHVLRYWEQEFRQLAPVKRRGNRRYYRVADIETARAIRDLLYQQGFTIAGARLQLDGRAGPSSDTTLGTRLSELRSIRRELEAIYEKLAD